MTVEDRDPEYLRLRREADAALATGRLAEARRAARRALAIRPGDQEAAEILRAASEEDVLPPDSPTSLLDSRFRTATLGVFSGIVIVAGTLLPWETTLGGAVKFRGAEHGGTWVLIIGLGAIALFVIWAAVASYAEQAINGAVGAGLVVLWQAWTFGQGVADVAALEVIDVEREIGVGLYVSAAGALGLIATVIDYQRSQAGGSTSSDESPGDGLADAPVPPIEETDRSGRMAMVHRFAYPWGMVAAVVLLGGLVVIGSTKLGVWGALVEGGDRSPTIGAADPVTGVRYNPVAALGDPMCVNEPARKSGSWQVSAPTDVTPTDSVLRSPVVLGLREKGGAGRHDVSVRVTSPSGVMVQARGTLVRDQGLYFSFPLSFQPLGPFPPEKGTFTVVWEVGGRYAACYGFELD